MHKVDEVIERLRFQNENGLFASIRAGKEANLDQAADLLAAMKEALEEIADLQLNSIVSAKKIARNTLNGGNPPS